YGDAQLATGGTISQGERNNTLYTMTLRGGYEVSPAMRPFVEGEVGRRLYDARTDSAGFARSATRYGARAGLEFGLGEKFSGELAAGWLGEKPDDARLPLLSGLTADASVVWSPIRGTIVNLDVSTEVEAATFGAGAGTLVYAAGLG